MKKRSALSKKRDLFLKSVFKNKKYEVFPLTEEGSDRRYARIKTEESSWVLACSPVEQQNRFLLRQGDFSAAGLNVPQWTARDLKKGFLLLEDLGDQSLEKEVLGSKEFPFSYYFQALDQIIKWQGSKKILPSFTKENFFKEMLWTEQYLIKCFFNLKPEKNLRSGYLKEWESLCEQLVCFPLLPAHRDYHSRNLFIKDQKLYLIDFQDAGFFPRFYDVVSLLYDVYVHSKTDNKEREKLLDYFLCENFFPEKIRTEEIKQEVIVTALQRLFKACGSFAGFYALKKQRTHLKYISPALKIVKKHLVDLKLYPCFLSLIDLCVERVEEK